MLNIIIIIIILLIFSLFINISGFENTTDIFKQAEDIINKIKTDKLDALNLYNNKLANLNKYYTENDNNKQKEIDLLLSDYKKQINDINSIYQNDKIKMISILNNLDILSNEENIKKDKLYNILLTI